MSVITLNINGLNTQKANIDRMDEKNQKQPYDPMFAVYRRHSSDSKTQVGWK